MKRFLRKTPFLKCRIFISFSQLPHNWLRIQFTNKVHLRVKLKVLSVLSYKSIPVDYAGLHHHQSQLFIMYRNSPTECTEWAIARMHEQLLYCMGNPRLFFQAHMILLFILTILATKFDNCKCNCAILHMHNNKST